MKLHLQGLGSAAPPHHIAQDDAAAMASATFGGGRQLPALAQIYRRSGVQTRHCVVLDSSTNGEPARQSFFPAAADAGSGGPTTAARMRAYDAAAATLAAEAARQALQEAAVEPTAITHLVTASCTGFSAPGVDLRLCAELGLSPTVARTHLGFMGCHAALNALRVADAYAADPGCRVLVCVVELCSLHFQYSDESERVVSNALFADGAAALVGRGGGGSGSWAALRAQTSLRLPDTAELMSWRIGDHGFQMGLSPRVPAIIRRRLREWCGDWLQGCGLAVPQIAHWAIHPGGPRILDACGEALDLAPERLAASRGVLARWGNMSSPTVLFVLDALRRQGACGPCVLLAFGPGLTIEAALLELAPAGGGCEGSAAAIVRDALVD